MIDKIPTFSIYQQAINGFNTVQDQLNQVQLQVSSGNLAQNFSDLDGNGADNVSQTLNLSTLITANGVYSQNNSLVVNQLQSYDNTMQQLQQVNTQLQNALVTEESATSATNPLAETAQNLLGTVENLLNTQFNGQYIFSGSKTDTPPVGNLQTSSNLINNIPSDNYYQGDNVTLTTQAGVNVNVQYGIKANNPAFSNLIGALNLAIQAAGSANPNSSPDLTAADNLSNQAVSQLSNLRAQNGDTMSDLQQINTNYSTDQTYLQNVQGNILDTDVASASVQVSQDQTTLQASYEIFARLASLNLASILGSTGG